MHYSPTITTTVSTAIAQAIMARADHVFGLVGNANSHVVSFLTAAEFPYTSTRHEVAAVTAADAFYRAGGGIAVATTTCGAGFTNTITALAEARAARIPLVYVTGSAPTRGPRPFDLDQAGMVKALGIDLITVSPETVLADMDAAFDLAEKNRVPVVVNLPFDIQTATVTADETVFSGSEMSTTSATTAHFNPPPHASDADVEAAAGILRASKRTLIISGRGVVLSDTSGQVRDLGDRLGALHMHSAMARNVIDTPWSLGTAGGFTHPSYVEITQQADTVLILGASWNQFQFRGGNLVRPDATVVHVDVEKHPASQRSDLRVSGDLRDVLPRLTALLPDVPLSSWRDSLTAVPAAEDRETMPDLFNDYGPDGRLDPRGVMRRLNEILPTDRAVTTDGGHFLGWVPLYLESPCPQSQVIVGTAIQTIGLGFPSAVGVTAARPSDFTVLVTGDGGGLMAIADAETFIRTARRGAVIVMNDAAYGAELHQFRNEGLDTGSMLIPDVDFAALGRGFGARGITIESPEDFDLVEKELAAQPEGVIVLDVKISREIIADFIAEVLKKQ
ncbi:thiamine pyrophosphate-binding protein [Corynebacterium sputi]|uniref:thiamine pyrophosphate-binding protein n=1 Tax=Corynebacterium sputi TaxID=489915 RepID=UPI000424BBF5|nr:thiamine pyrophosphate-binding protein [Corynebacterium sputi]